MGGKKTLGLQGHQLGAKTWVDCKVIIKTMFSIVK
jgi:hypothetical protein